MTRSVGAVRSGSPDPLGATVVDGGVNFSLWSPDATGVELSLFDRKDRREPAAVVVLDPAVHRTDNYWHVAVSKVRSGTPYAYRVDGPYRPEDGLRFDRSKLLLDPYAKAVIDDDYDRTLATRFGASNLRAPCSAWSSIPAATTGRATNHSVARSAAVRSTKRTSGGSRSIRAPASAGSRAAPTPA